MTSRFPATLLLIAVFSTDFARAQDPAVVPGVDPAIAQAAEQKEQSELSLAVAEANGSPIDLIHVLEHHLAKYPASKERNDIEHALAKNAMDTNDSPRIILYGEMILARETPDDLMLIDRVTRALLDKEDKDRAKRALIYASRYVRDVNDLYNHPPADHLTPVQWREQLDKALARALTLQARATGFVGQAEDAVQVALHSWMVYPTADGAREAAYWLAKLSRDTDALEYYADAFTLEDPRSTEVDRASDRKRLGELYAKKNGSEKGLGELILAAYDRTSGILAGRLLNMKAKDPNSAANSILDYRLPGIAGAQPLTISSLKGKAIVLDFWATWCAPCRAQHPLIENVKKHFADAPDVAFLSVAADDDPAVVPPFLKDIGWTGDFYFEGGLARQLSISSIPTILILDPTGAVSSRMAGFNPERFESLLIQRIEDARAAKPLNP